MSQPESDNGTIGTVVEKVHRERVPQGMRRDAFFVQGGTMTASHNQVLVEQIFQAVMTQGIPSCGRKDRIGSLSLTFSQPTAQHCDGLFAKRSAPAFASFSQALHVCTGTQSDVLTAQVGEFCCAQS